MLQLFVILQSARFFFLPKTGTVLVVNCAKEISPIHVSSFQGVGSAIFLASSASMLYKMKVTLSASKDGSNSSAVLEDVAGHRTHPTHSNEDGTAASLNFSCVGSLWRVLPQMGAGFVFSHQRKSFRIGWRPSATATKLTVWLKRDLEKSINVRSELWISRQRLKGRLHGRKIGYRRVKKGERTAYF